MKGMFLLAFLLICMRSEIILQYHFSDNSIITDIGIHECDPGFKKFDCRIPLMETLNQTRLHFGSRNYILSTTTGQSLTTRDFRFLKSMLLSENGFEINLETKMQHPSIVGEMCLFCIKRKDFQVSSTPLDLCDNFDVVISWVGSSIRFLTRTSTNNCKYASKFITLTPDIIKDPLVIKYVHNNTHVGLSIKNGPSYYYRQILEHDYSIWSDTQKIYIGPIIQIVGKNDGIQFFTANMKIQDKQDTSEQHTNNFQYYPQQIVTHQRYYTQNDESVNEDSESLRNKKKLHSCKCPRHIGHYDVVEESERQKLCHVPPREEDLGICLSGSGSCNCIDEYFEESEKKCLIPVYWSYNNNGDPIVSDVSNLRFEIANTTFSHQHSFPTRLEFSRGSHHILYRSVIKFERTCKDIKEFNLKVHLSDKTIGYLNIEYKGFQEWDVHNVPIHSDLILLCMIPMKRLEHQILEKVLMKNEFPFEHMNLPNYYELMRESNNIVYWMDNEIISHDKMFKNVNEFYIIFKTPKMIKLKIQQYNRIKEIYGYSNNFKELYTFNRGNINCSRIEQFESNQVNQSSIISIDENGMIGPFRNHQCLMITFLENTELNYYDGRSVSKLKNNTEICIDFKHSPKLEDIKKKSTDPWFIIDPSKIKESETDSNSCKWFDKCKICNGDNSKCPIFMRVNDEQCILENTKCYVIPPKIYDETQIMDSKFKAFFNTTLFSIDDYVIIDWGCKTSSKLNRFDYEIQKNTSCNNTHHIIGKYEFTFKDFVECSKSIGGIASPHQKQFNIKVHSKRGLYFSIPCNVHIEMELIGNATQNSTHVDKSTFLMTEYTTNSIALSTEKKSLLFKDCDLYYTFETCYNSEYLNDTMESGQIEYYGDELRMSKVKYCIPNDVTKRCCNTWSLYSSGNYFYSHNLLKSELSIQMKVRNKTFETLLNIEQRHQCIKKQIVRKIEKQKSNYIPSLCFYKDITLQKEVSKFNLGDKVFMKLTLTHPNIKGSCNSGFCPLGNKVVAAINRINICIHDKPNAIGGCDSPGWNKYTLVDFLGGEKRSGKMWDVGIKYFDNCTSSILFSYVPNKSIYRKLINHKTYYEIVMDTVDNDHILKYTDNLKKSENLASKFVEHVCADGLWYDIYTQSCVSPSSWYYSWITNELSTFLVFLIIVPIMLCFIIFGLRYMHIIHFVENDDIKISDDENENGKKEPQVQLVDHVNVYNYVYLDNDEKLKDD